MPGRGVRELDPGTTAMRSEFWDGRRVFVTGHTGFKGSWLTLWLEHLGANVTGYSIGIPTTPSLYEAAGVGAGIESITGDVRNLAAVSAALHAAQPEVIFHLAAQSLVRRSYQEPVETFATNVLGTVNVLEAARAVDCLRSVVVVTSDKCYRPAEAAHAEDDALGGDDPYSASKAAAELVAAAYRHAFFPKGHAAVASVRAGNVIGGGDWADDRLVPDLARAARTRGTAVVRNPDYVRPWQHVLGPLSGYLLLAERMERDASLATGWNFGPAPDEACSVRALVEALLARWPAAPAVQYLDPVADEFEAPALRLDSARARERLDWRPAWRLERALDETVEWYAAFAGGTDVRALTHAQIERYEQDERG